MPSKSSARSRRTLRTVREPLHRPRTRARVALRRRLSAAVDYYFHPVHAEFAPRTAWSLHNSVTETLKTLPPAPAFHSAARVGRFFETWLK